VQLRIYNIHEAYKAMGHPQVSDEPRLALVVFFRHSESTSQSITSAMFARSCSVGSYNAVGEGKDHASARIVANQLMLLRTSGGMQDDLHSHKSIQIRSICSNGPPMARRQQNIASASPPRNASRNVSSRRSKYPQMHSGITAITMHGRATMRMITVHTAART